ncbi:integrin alpha-PS1 isoform X1 [Lutzomyia longipalpis]|uniref:integrin alpha-PS1 isoform X1 n=1 Tax=Lutzomyia longipalpis TaxID=7200 RepID=UPI002483C0FA|nr:integrin alpha-PS1 isoform X1 [Lutzomyia longipalpis]
MSVLGKMSASSLFWPAAILISVYILLSLHLVSCFNLENRLPIIKYGEGNSYFGYSVAMHVIGEKDSSDNRKWLLVGAPLGQNLQPGTNHSGALYKCPITQNNNDCSQIITDGRRLPGGAYEPFLDDDDGIENLMPPVKTDELKDDQWMGVTVRSQGANGKVLVCAHRYIAIMGESRFGQGLCYVLSNDLKYDEIYEPCKGRSTARAHEDFGYCQAGTSGALLDDDTVILGSPGPLTWRGMIFVISIGGEYLTRDKTNYYSPHTDASSPVDKYSYLGMAVTGGRYFGSHMSYAAGAPRSAGHGQVMIFSKGNPPTSNPINLTATLDGEQFASSFGYELATADVNGDGRPDLLVSAPFYFSRDEGGAVYIYQNERNHLPAIPKAKLTGKLESRFGLALANLGDINKDGYEDIAIGAPYENDGVVYIYLGSESGLNRKPSQVIAASDVHASLKTFGSSLSGGIDVDNNSYPDLLIGAYSSSAAIVLLARPITNITTKVEGTYLTNIDPAKSGCPSDPGTNLTCFSFKACCAIEQMETSTSFEYLHLKYVIEAETFNNQKKFSRVFFGPDFKKRSNVMRRSIQVKSNGQMDCIEETVYIKEGTRDIQSPIKFRLNYTFVEPKLKESGLIALNPILNQAQANRKFEATFQKDCGSDDICESQLEVSAELELPQEDNQYTLVLGERDELQLNVMVTNQEDSAYEAQLFILHQQSVSYIAAIRSGAVICNRFNETIVACTLGNPLRRDGVAKVTLRFDPSGLEDSVPRLNFRIWANSTSKQISEVEPTVLDVKVVKKVQISVKGWARPEQSFYGGEIKGESAMEYFDDVGTIIHHTYQIYNDGPWNAPHIDVRIMWPHQVANDKEQGKWLLYLEEEPTIEGANGAGECFRLGDKVINPLGLKRRSQTLQRGFLEDELPPEPYIRRTHNKTAFYSAASYEKASMGSSKFESASANRVRRDHAVVIKADNLVDKDGKKSDVVHMDCARKTAKCVEIHCAIYRMQRKTEVYIHVKARLWNSTLVADYPRVDRVHIVSRAQISIPELYGIEQPRGNDSAAVETLAYPELLDVVGDGPVPIWVYVLSILFGILVLVILVLIMWKCGFFKRRRPDPTLSGNLEKSETKPFISK